MECATLTDIKKSETHKKDIVFILSCVYFLFIVLSQSKIDITIRTTFWSAQRSLTWWEIIATFIHFLFHMWQVIRYCMYHLISPVKPFYEVDTLTIFILKMSKSRHRHLREMFKVCDSTSWLRIITGKSFLVFHVFLLPNF